MSNHTNTKMYQTAFTEKIWKNSNHKRGTAKGRKIQQMPICRSHCPYRQQQFCWYFVANRKRAFKRVTTRLFISIDRKWRCVSQVPSAENARISLQITWYFPPIDCWFHANPFLPFWATASFVTAIPQRKHSDKARTHFPLNINNPASCSPYRCRYAFSHLSFFEHWIYFDCFPALLQQWTVHPALLFLSHGFCHIPPVVQQPKMQFWHEPQETFERERVLTCFSSWADNKTGRWLVHSNQCRREARRALDRWELAGTGTSEQFRWRVSPVHCTGYLQWENRKFCRGF